MKLERRAIRARAPIREVRHEVTMPKSKELWTAEEAAEWAGVHYRVLLRLLRAGAVPCIPVGRACVLQMRNGTHRKRSCSKYMVPKLAFQRWFRNIGCPDPSMIGKTAVREAAHGETHA
jgi:hypothetical protein